MTSQTDSRGAHHRRVIVVATGASLIAFVPFSLVAQARPDSSASADTSTTQRAAVAQAQTTSQPITLCIVPGSGTAYRVGEPGLPTQCIAATHTPLSLNLTGPQGVQGLTGAKGDSGPMGPAGVPGAKGDSGAVGAKGDAGATGPQGIAGVQGLIGPAGRPGDAGTAGEAGPPGEAGPAGALGPMGPVGPAGTAGAPGADGAAGAAGQQGIQGIQGIQGTQGMQGIQGDAGQPGTTDHSLLTNLTADDHAQYLIAGPRTALNGFSVSGTRGQGALAPSGSGTRLVWNPAKAAFRAGEVSSNQWDDYSMGNWSAAFGRGTIANGVGSLAAGWDSRANGEYSTAFGHSTLAHGAASFAVGMNAQAFGDESFAGGSGTYADGRASFAMGLGGSASGDASAAFSGYATGAHSLAVGRYSQASAPHAIALGQNASAAGVEATAIGHGLANGNKAVSIGYQNRAEGEQSMALGNGAVSAFAGSVVINAQQYLFDTDTVAATGANQFVVGAKGGIEFWTGNGGVVRLLPGSSSWDNVSDRNKKTAFRDVDGESLLIKLRSVPVSSWTYKAQDQAIRHIGPMAQDWHQAFALNSSTTTINSGDIAGVTLAGVQALEVRTSVSTQRINELELQVQALMQELRAMREASGRH